MIDSMLQHWCNSRQLEYYTQFICHFAARAKRCMLERHQETPELRFAQILTIEDFSVLP